MGTKRGLLTRTEFRKEEHLKPAEGLKILVRVQKEFLQGLSKKTNVSG
jgi:hypothetical protein